jgi:hypothetical protein
MNTAQLTVPGDRTLMIRRITLPIVAAVALFAFSAPISLANPSPTLASPTNLSQSVLGHTVTAGSWSRSRSLTVTLRSAGNGGWLHAQVQVSAAGSNFHTVAGAKGTAVQAPKGTLVTLSATLNNLKDGGAYIWQVRTADTNGATSAWVPFTTAGTVAIRTDLTAPSPPTIVSSNAAIKNGYWSRATSATFSWSATDRGSGVAGYSYSFSQKLHAARPAMHGSNMATFAKVPDGHWFLHVWARDVAGNWSRLSVFKFNIDHTAPKIAFKGVTSDHFNPYLGKQTISFTLSHQAAVHVQIHLKKWILRTENLGTLGVGTHTYIWAGKGQKGDLTPKGWYYITMTTQDKLGNTGTYASAGFHDNPIKPVYPFVYEPGRHIVVSLSKEAIYAYDGYNLVKWSFATTGNPALPTPTGHYEIFARFSPFEFISPWPEGSPYYYAPSWVSHAMEFQGEGYFIHDAPWRTVFGPGSDGPGTPGTNYGGTHGCVNVPNSMSDFLWNWSTIGTPVDIID